MSPRFFLSSALAALAASTVACSSSDNPANPGTAPDGGGAPGTGGGGGATGGTVGTGGSVGGGGTGGAADAAKEGSASCGDAPILGDFWASPPADCTACAESSCCSERGACTADANCEALRTCLAACGQFDAACQSACSAKNPPGAANTAFNACGTEHCASCLDFSCEGTAWPAPATAHDIAMKATLVSFTTGKPVAGVTVKVCAHNDGSCAGPIDQGVTASDGTVSLTVPAAAGGTDAYLEQSGAGIETEMSYLYLLTGDAAYSNLTLQVLDTTTAAAFQTLAGGVPLSDGGTLSDGGPTPYGALAVLPRSCKGAVVAGATVTSSNAGAAAVTSYLVKGVPSKTATATDSTGIAAIVDHARGHTTVTVKVGTKTLGTADVIVRPNALTTVALPPN